MGGGVYLGVSSELNFVHFSVQLSLFEPVKAPLSLVELLLYVTGLFVLFSCSNGSAHPFHAVNKDVNEVNSW